MKNSFNLSSDEIRVFGGFELFVKENEIDIPNCNLTVSGDFSFDCMNNLVKYLYDEDQQLNSFTYSKDLKTAYLVANYSIAKDIIIPEGVTNLEKMFFLYKTEETSSYRYSYEDEKEKKAKQKLFVKYYIENLYLPNSLLTIQENTFSEAKINNITIENTYFKMINNQLVNIFSKERIFTIATKKIPEKTLELWKNLNKYDLNVIYDTEFWITKFNNIKDSLKDVPLDLQNKHPIQALKTALLSFPDFCNTWEIRSRKDKTLPRNIKDRISYLCLNAEKYINYYGIPVVFSEEDKEPILSYTSECIIPNQQIEIIFQLDYTGINMIILDFNMFILIPKKDLGRIKSFIEYLETNMYNIIKHAKDTSNQTIADNQMKAEMEINNQDRSNILNSL